MSFVNCTFTADGGVTSVTLAGSNGQPGNNVSWFGCDFSPKYVAPPVLFTGNTLFWQAENTQNAAPVAFANVTTHAGTDAEMLAATNVTVWLYGWTPVISTPAVPPTSSNLTVLGDGNFQFSISGGDGQSYRVWASSDVTLTPITSTWTEVGNGTFGASPVTFTDTQATNYPNRYYIITVP